jgi:hypothetical protein
MKIHNPKTLVPIIFIPSHWKTVADHHDEEITRPFAPFTDPEHSCILGAVRRLENRSCKQTE